MYVDILHKMCIYVYICILKSSSILGFIKRNTHNFSNIKALNILYMELV
jgi:hypothetical protein